MIASLAIAAGPRGRRWVATATATSARNVRLAVKSAVTALLLGGLAAVLGLGLLVSLAPLTGSDAMAYHFDAPPLYARAGHMFPMFGLVHSFFIGSGHLLILLGMVLGSDQLGVALCYAGGLLTALAAYALARKWLPRDNSLFAAFLFLITPMTFWQMNVAGAPDLWGAFFATTALLSFVRWLEDRLRGTLVLCALLAGLAASVKYTGWSVPIVLGTLVAFYSRGSPATIGAFVSGALLAGAWRYVLNVIWTGDPVFPYLSWLLGSSEFNAYAYQAVVLDTRAPGYQLSLQGLLLYAFNMVVDGNRFGAGQLFGPLVLSLAPAALRCRHPRHWNALLLFSAGVFILNATTTQMARFLLPIYPAVLVLVIGSLHQLASMPWQTVVVRADHAAVGLFVSFPLLFVVTYASDFLPVAVGMENREQFLRVGWHRLMVWQS